MPDPIQVNGANVDLAPRVFRTATVVASPTGSTETIIASITLNRDLAFSLGVLLVAFAAWTVGTNGVSVNIKLRRTDASGTTVKATGAVTQVAANLDSRSVVAIDTGPTMPNQVYVMTMTVASGSAASTVSAVELAAVVL